MYNIYTARPGPEAPGPFFEFLSQATIARWAPEDAMPAASSASRGLAAARPPSRGSTPCCEEEPPDDEVLL